MAMVVARLAVGDYDRALRDMQSIAERAKEPGELLKMLEENFYWQLPQRLEMAEDLAKIATAVGQAQAAKAKAKKA